VETAFSGAVVEWARALGCFFEGWGKYSIGFVWLLHRLGQARKLLIPERDVLQCRKWKTISDRKILRKKVNYQAYLL